MTTMLQEQQPVQVEVKEKIDLTETEKRIFDRLLGTLRHFNLQTQLRVAGGWVRDKVSHSLNFPVYLHIRAVLFPASLGVETCIACVYLYACISLLKILWSGLFQKKKIMF